MTLPYPRFFSIFVWRPAFPIVGLLLLLLIVARPAYGQYVAPSNIEVGDKLLGHLNLFDLEGSPAASELGQWSDVAMWPINGIHAALLPSGKVITYGRDPLNVGSGFVYDLWDPELGLRPSSHTTLDVQTGNDIFCSAQHMLPGSGGMLMVTGGSVTIGSLTLLGIDAVNLFDPISKSFFKPVNAMHRTRWYPSLVGLQDGTLLCMGGRDDERAPELTPELFNPTTGTWDLLTGATSEEVFGEGGWSYPRAFLAPNGKTFLMPNKRRRAYYLSVEGNGSIEPAIDFSSTVSTNRQLAVMYRQHKLLNLRDEDALILTLRANGDISIKDVADLATKRFWSEAVILANGEVMVTGGSTVSQDRDTAIYYTEIWNPETEQWRVGAEAKVARLYHTASILLPSGVVLSNGGSPGGGVQQLSAEVYYPDYLFEPNGDLRVRPRLLGRVPETPKDTVIEIRAVGDEGTEEFDLMIDDQVVETFQVTTELETYSYRHPMPVTGDQVTVEFTNDEFDPPEIDSNLTVDYIRIDGRIYPTDNPFVFSSNLGETGFFRNETLFSNGFFRYWDRSDPYLQLGPVDYNSTERLFFDRATSIEKVMLIKFGSTTHSFDMGQRGYEVSFAQQGSELEVQIPRNSRVCPPGHYMLFAIDDQGTPSRAAILEILDL